MKNIKLVLTTALLTTLFSCVNGDDYGTPDLSGECEQLTANLLVSDVLSSANASLQMYENVDENVEDIIEAYVTSSDEGGNFYKSISLVSVDGSQGFTIPVDAYNLYTKFEPGRKVFIYMDSLYYTFDSQIASTEIGALYNNNTIDNPNDDAVGRLSGVMYENIIKRSCTKVDEEDIMVQNMSINDITADNTYMHKLIELDNVQFTDGSVGGKYYDDSYPDLNFSNPVYPSNIGGATNHQITDINGNTIIVRVSEYATFAGDAIPSGSGKIRGVLTYYQTSSGEPFQFMIRTLNDVQLDNPRIVPLFEETFDTGWANWTKYSVVGAQVWTLGTDGYGNPGNYARMSGYSGGNQTNDDWLISPAIDLSSVASATLTFDTAKNYTGNALEIFLSNDYDGSSAPSTATWTPVSAPLSTGSWNWVSSGDIDLASYIGGNVYVAFRYTSTTSASSTWEVDNVKVQ